MNRESPATGLVGKSPETFPLPPPQTRSHADNTQIKSPQHHTNFRPLCLSLSQSPSPLLRQPSPNPFPPHHGELIFFGSRI